MDLHLNLRKTELAFDIFLIAVGGVLFYQSAITKATIEEPVTASMYGMVISALFLFSLLIRFFKLAASKSSADEEKEVCINHFPLIMFSAVFALLYTIGIIKIGYYVSTLAFTTIMIMVLRKREERTQKAWIMTVIGCLLFTVVLYFLFKAFKVYLPNAWLI